MARKSSFSHGGWELGKLGKEAVAFRNSNGARERYRLGVPRSPDAQARSALIAFVDARQRAGLIEGGLLIKDIWALYLADRTRDGKRVINMTSRWKYLGPHYGELSVDELTDDVHREFALHMERNGYAPGTTHSTLMMFRAAMQWAYKKRHIPRPAILWNILTPQPKQRIVTEEEIALLLEHAVDQAVRLFIFIAACSGARHQAILELTWDRVNLEASSIDFRRPLTGRSVVDKGFLKGRAFVPFGPTLRAALATAKASAKSEFVIERNGKRVNMMTQTFTTTRLRAGVSEGVTPHALRHTAATWTNASDNIERAAKLLGHKNHKTTEGIYIKPDIEPLRGAVLSIEDRINRGKRTG